MNHATSDDVRALVGSEEDLEKWNENEHYRSHVLIAHGTHETRSLRIREHEVSRSASNQRGGQGKPNLRSRWADRHVHAKAHHRPSSRPSRQPVEKQAEEGCRSVGCCGSVCCLTIRRRSSLTGPGATALTRIPLGASWAARALVKETIAPLVAE